MAEKCRSCEEEVPIFGEGQCEDCYEYYEETPCDYCGEIECTGECEEED